MMLEIAKGDGPQPIVRAFQRLADGVVGAGIIEPGQQNEGAVSNIAVAVFGGGLEQCGNGLRALGPPNGAGRIRASVVIEIAELVDRDLQLLGTDRLRRGGLLRGLGGRFAAAETEDTQEGEDAEAQRHTYPTGVFSSSLSAS
jgi:hypothetical protein